MQDNEYRPYQPHEEQAHNLPVFDHQSEVNFSEGEFIFNGGHYNQMDPGITNQWLKQGIAREVLIKNSAYPFLVVDTHKLKDWLDVHFNLSSSEKMKRYAAYILFILTSFFTEDNKEEAETPVIIKEPQTSLRQRINRALRSEETTLKVERVGTVMSFFRQEIRQNNLPTSPLDAVHGYIRALVEGTLGQIKDEGIKSFLAERPAKLKRLEMLSESLNRNAIKVSDMLFFYTQQIDRARDLFNLVRQERDTLTWASDKASDELESLEKAIAFMKKVLPSAETLSNFYLTLADVVIQMRTLLTDPDVNENNQQEVHDFLLEQEKKIHSVSLGLSSDF